MYETIIENPGEAAAAFKELYDLMKSEFPKATDDLEKIELIVSGRELRLRDASLNCSVRYSHKGALDPCHPLRAFLVMPRWSPLVARTSLAHVLNALYESKTGRVKLSLVTRKDTEYSYWVLGPGITDPKCELKLEDVDPPGRYKGLIVEPSRTLSMLLYVWEQVKKRNSYFPKNARDVILKAGPFGMTLSHEEPEFGFSAQIKKKRWDKEGKPAEDQGPLAAFLNIPYGSVEGGTARLHNVLEALVWEDPLPSDKFVVIEKGILKIESDLFMP
jgi:hypothetical protein